MTNQKNGDGGIKSIIYRGKKGNIRRLVFGRKV